MSRILLLRPANLYRRRVAIIFHATCVEYQKRNHIVSDQLFSVSGQHVLITGGSRGIGRAIAEGFAARGAKVMICSRSQESVETAVKEMNEAGMAVTGLTCDVSDPEQIKSTVVAAIDQLVHIDTLINVAGVNRRQRAETFMTGQTLYVDGGFSSGWNWPIPLS